MIRIARNPGRAAVVDLGKGRSISSRIRGGDLTVQVVMDYSCGKASHVARFSSTLQKASHSA